MDRSGTPTPGIVAPARQSWRCRGPRFRSRLAAHSSLPARDRGRGRPGGGERHPQSAVSRADFYGVLALARARRRATTSSSPGQPRATRRSRVVRTATPWTTAMNAETLLHWDLRRRGERLRLRRRRASCTPISRCGARGCLPSTTWAASVGWRPRRRLGGARARRRLHSSRSWVTRIRRDVARAWRGRARLHPRPRGRPRHGRARPAAATRSVPATRMPRLALRIPPPAPHARRRGAGAVAGVSARRARPRTRAIRVGRRCGVAGSTLHASLASLAFRLEAVADSTMPRRAAPRRRMARYTGHPRGELVDDPSIDAIAVACLRACTPRSRSPQ